MDCSYRGLNALTLSSCALISHLHFLGSPKNAKAKSKCRTDRRGADRTAIQEEVSFSARWEWKQSEIELDYILSS